MQTYTIIKENQPPNILNESVKKTHQPKLKSNRKNNSTSDNTKIILPPMMNQEIVFFFQFSIFNIYIYIYIYIYQVPRLETSNYCCFFFFFIAR